MSQFGFIEREWPAVCEAACAALAELRQVMHADSESAIHRLLAEMRSEGRVTLRGSRRWAHWVIASPKAQEMGKP